MDVKLREMDLLLIFHQLPVLNLFGSIFLLLTVARPFKPDERQPRLIEAASTLVSFEHIKQGLSA